MTVVHFYEMVHYFTYICSTQSLFCSFLFHLTFLAREEIACYPRQTKVKCYLTVAMAYAASDPSGSKPEYHSSASTLLPIPILVVYMKVSRSNIYRPVAATSCTIFFR